MPTHSLCCRKFIPERSNLFEKGLVIICIVNHDANQEHFELDFGT